MLDLRGLHPVGEHPPIQQGRQQHPPPVGHRKHQREIFGVEHALPQRLRVATQRDAGGVHRVQ